MKAKTLIEMTVSETVLPVGTILSIKKDDEVNYMAKADEYPNLGLFLVETKEIEILP